MDAARDRPQPPPPPQLVPLARGTGSDISRSFSIRSPPEKRPPRDYLYMKKYVSLAEYRVDHREGTVAKYAKLPREEKVALFGSSIVPIYVPLAPNETKEQYEARFEDWLERVHGVSRAELEHHEDEKIERFYWIKFAGLNATGKEQFQPEAGPQGIQEERRPRGPRRRRRSPSPALSANSSGGSRVMARATETRSGRDRFYAKKYVELDRFQIEVNMGRVDEYETLSDAKKKELFDSTIVPIHVPLARGELMRQYEARFVEWIERKGVTLAELENDRDELRERAYRIRFARLNSDGSERFGSDTRKRERSTGETSPRPVKKTAHEREIDTSTDWKPTRPAKAVAPESTKSEVQAPGCAFVAPAPGTKTSDVAAAYIACGCRQCLVNGMRSLSEKIVELGRQAADTNSAGPKKRRVVDLTQDDEPPSPKHKPSDLSAAITRLVTSAETVGELQQQAAAMSRTNGELEISEDLVENQLVGEYQQINQQVLKKETLLDDVATQLSRAPVTDVSETTRQQDEIEQLRDVIQKQSDDRSAALAMVAVYMWRRDQDELMRRIQDVSADDALHTQRSSHKKCSLLSITISEQRARVAETKATLDAAMVNKSLSGPEHIRCQLAVLSDLGNKLTTAENELRGLLRLRREEFATLIQYDKKLRLLIKTLLATAD